MKWNSTMKWEQGRQDSGYLKKRIYSVLIFGIGLDCYLIKYPKGANIKSHVDAVDGKKHKRLNIILKQSKIGGQFIKNGKLQTGRIHYFRPDIDEHSVSEIREGTRIVLSFGIAH